MDLQKFFNPKTIAVVGASEKEGTVGNIIAKNALKLGYQGEVFLVNPKYKNLFGRECYENLAKIEKEIDLAVIAIPAKLVNDEIKKNSGKIKNFIVISAGYSETGEEGKEREEKLLEIAKKNNLNILGPNCLGFINPKIKLNASFAGGMPEAGTISFISQSGALLAALMDMTKKEKIKISSLISIGNKMQISESEILEFLINDENTKAVGFYLESIKNGKEFMKSIQKFSAAKPVVILKTGKNEKTQEAISSHTGALAGSDEIISAALKKAGALRAENLEEFFGLLNLLNNFPKNSGQESVIITNAGGAGVLATDAFNGKNVRLAKLGSDIKKELKKNLPAESSVENPIDLLGDAKEDRYGKVLEIISQIKEIGSVICLLTPQEQTPVEKIAEEIIKFKNKTDKIVAAVFLGGEKVETAVEKLKIGGVCSFNFPDLAVSVIDKYCQWNVFHRSENKREEQFINEKRKNAAEKIIRNAKNENRSALYYFEAKRIMEIYGINAAEYLEIFPNDDFPSGSDMSFKFPVVLKVDSDKILHKTDKNGLVLNIQNQEELKKAVSLMKINFPGNRFIVQPMAEKGLEIIAGIKRDPIFGPVAVYGLGGIYTEIFKMVDYLIPPLTVSQAEGTLLKGKLGFLFQGVRGQKKYDVQNLSRLILATIAMAIELPEIKEFDINPAVIYNDGKEPIALDIKIII
jgi:acetyltransferase